MVMTMIIQGLNLNKQSNNFDEILGFNKDLNTFETLKMT